MAVHPTDWIPFEELEDVSIYDTMYIVPDEPETDDPVILYAHEFFRGTDVMGMIKYQASLRGNDIYPGIEPIACTQLEMEGEMQSISPDVHMKYVSSVSNFLVNELKETYDTNYRSFSERQITCLLYTNYVSKYVTVIEGKNVFLWQFDNGIWKERSTASIWQDLSTTIITYMKRHDMSDIARFMGSVNTREKIQKDLIYRLADSTFIDKLNAHTHLIGMKNGIYDTDTGELRAARVHDYVSMSTGINLIDSKYEERTERLIHILAMIFPDADVLYYFIRSCAMLLEGGNKDKLIHVWWGKGNNGKSMIEKLLSKTLGDYATVAATSLITGKRGMADNASPQLAILEGKLVVFLQEPNPNEVIRIGMVKELTGGDAITARQLYREPKTFIPKFKLVIVCNNVMEIPSIDVAFKNRLVVIPFQSTFHKKIDKPGPYDFPMDTNIAKNIGDYSDVFLRMLVDEYERIKREKKGDYIKPESIESATREYIEWNNSVLRFFSEHVVYDKDAEYPLDQLYREYKIWMLDNSSKRPVDFQVFRDEVISQGYDIIGKMVQSVIF
jgi:P4 family phage/plasmid primase-like protien